MTESKQNSSDWLLPAALVLAALILAGSIFMVGNGLTNKVDNLSTAMAALAVNAEKGTKSTGSLAETDGTDATDDTVETTDGSDDTGGEVIDAQDPEPQAPATIGRPFGTFNETAEEICLEDGKPVVYLFSTTWCYHCKWIKSTIDETLLSFANEGKIAAYHFELDNGDNTLTAETESIVADEHQAVYRKFNPRGSIPTFVFGCKYYRVGNGYELAFLQGKTEEEKQEYFADEANQEALDAYYSDPENSELAQADLAKEMAEVEAVINALIEEAEGQ